MCNEDKLEKGDLFFDGKRENIPGEEILSRIDNNVKGLGKDEHKFFSISVNPSHDELEWIGSDRDKFKSYIKETMKNYAGSFRGDGIMENDLVWGAVIHEKRYYTAKEVYVWNKKNEGKRIAFKEGDTKPGNQMHAHIIVSARDKAMAKTLNVLTSKNKISRKFELKGFQKKNQDSFQSMFYFKNGVNIYAETQKRVVEEKCGQLARFGYRQEDFEKINRVGEKMNFDSKFTRNLNRLVQECYKGNKIVDTEKYLELGDRKYKEEFADGIKEGAFESKDFDVNEQKEQWNELLSAVNDIERATKTKKQSKSEEQKRKRKRGKGF